MPGLRCEVKYNGLVKYTASVLVTTIVKYKITTG